MVFATEASQDSPIQIVVVMFILGVVVLATLVFIWPDTLKETFLAGARDKFTDVFRTQKNPSQCDLEQTTEFDTFTDRSTTCGRRIDWILANSTLSDEEARNFTGHELYECAGCRNGTEILSHHVGYLKCIAEDPRDNVRYRLCQSMYTGAGRAQLAGYTSGRREKYTDEQPASVSYACTRRVPLRRPRATRT